MVTPPGGTVLDLFAGTGTTGEAAYREGFNAVLIEREAEYQEDIRRRMALAKSGPNERKLESAKAKAKGKQIDMGPLFDAL
jgi:site-specific DNA-methyltransferase (adenine-specific)